MDSRLKALAATLSSGALYFFGTGYSPVWVLVWVAPLPVLLAAPRISAGLAAAAAFVAGLLGHTNTWAHAVHSFDVPLVPRMLISVGMAATLTVVVLLFRGLVRRGWPVLAAVAAAGAWTGVLYVVQVVNPMGLMGTPSGSVGDVPVVLQVASVTGMWGVEFLVLVVPAAVAAAVYSRALRCVGVAVALLGVTLVFGLVRLGGEGGAPQRVALMAPNQGQWAVDVRSTAGQDLVAAYAAQIAALPAGVQVVVLPEGEFGTDDAGMPSLVTPLARVARDRGVSIVVGVVRRAEDAKFNIALTIPAAGGDPVPYLKHHDTVSRLGRDLVFPPGVNAGIAICLDVNFADPSRDYALSGARRMLLPAADENANGWQHARLGLARGVENGFSVAWAARSGTLMLSDGYGRVVAEARTGGTGRFATVVADVPAGPGATLYSRLGDWFAWLCLAFAVLGVVLVRRGSPSRRRPRTPRP